MTWVEITYVFLCIIFAYIMKYFLEKGMVMKRLIIVFFFISAGLFGEETGLQIGNAGEGGGTFTFYDVVFGSGMIGILIWGLLFATSTAALVPWTPSVVRSEPDADFWKGISLKRGDVVAFYRIASDGTKTLD